MGSDSIHSCFQFSGRVYSSPAKAVSSNTSALPARSQLPEVRTIPPSQREVNWRSAMPCGENSALAMGSSRCSDPLINSLAFIDSVPSSLCHPPWLRVRLRRLRSRSVTAQSGPCKRASVTSRRPICSEGTLVSGVKNSVSDLSLCRRISLSCRLSTRQLPSALRLALPVSVPRAISAPSVDNVTSPLSRLPWISTLLASTPFRVSEPALI